MEKDGSRQETARLNYVDANMFLQGGEVLLKEYEATSEGIVQSWAERRI
jgi:dipeptidyl-peptidase III